jgi:hypothetical protein
MKRREFLKTSVAASTLASLGLVSLTATAAEPDHSMKREYYELRAYRLKAGAGHKLLDAYLEKALIPALNRAGIKPVGVFMQEERKDVAPSNEARDNSVLFVLIPHPTLDSVASTVARLNADAQYQQAGAEYLQSPKDKPAFDRIDSWLMLAFAGMPKLELAAYSRERKPRMFELRTYESHSEVKALKKVEMFNAGEIDTMREVGLAPVFYGQALAGPNLPHLSYMTSGENDELHQKHWDAFGKHPVWNKLKNDPQYADTVSKITRRFLTPLPYSQI